MWPSGGIPAEELPLLFWLTLCWLVSSFGSFAVGDEDTFLIAKRIDSETWVQSAELY